MNEVSILSWKSPGCISAPGLFCQLHWAQGEPRESPGEEQAPFSQGPGSTHLGCFLGTASHGAGVFGCYAKCQAFAWPPALSLQGGKCFLSLFLPKCRDSTHYPVISSVHHHTYPHDDADRIKWWVSNSHRKRLSFTLYGKCPTSFCTSLVSMAPAIPKEGSTDYPECACWRAEHPGVSPRCFLASFSIPFGKSPFTL
jgi:hypothetical protein